MNTGQNNSFAWLLWNVFLLLLNVIKSGKLQAVAEYFLKTPNNYFSNLEIELITSYTAVSIVKMSKCTRARHWNVRTSRPVITAHKLILIASTYVRNLYLAVIRGWGLLWVIGSKVERSYRLSVQIMRSHSVGKIDWEWF